MGTNKSDFSFESLVIGFLVLCLYIFGFDSSGYAISKADPGVESIVIDQVQSVEAAVVRDYCSFEGTLTDAATGGSVGNAQVTFLLGNSVNTLRTTSNEVIGKESCLQGSQEPQKSPMLQRWGFLPWL
jgi:hypothetical protein